MTAMLVLVCLMAPTDFDEKQARPGLPEPESVVVGSIRLAGRDVAVRFPKPGPPIPESEPHFDTDDWKYSFNPDGSLARRYKIDGGSADWQALYAAAQQAIAAEPKTPVWRLRVFVQTRWEILEDSRGGMLQMRRSTLEPSQITQTLEAIAQCKALAEGYAEGRLRIDAQVTIDDDPVRQVASEAKPLVDQAFLQRYFGARINRDPFEADDKVYRGPYDSVLVIHPALTPTASEVHWVSDTPTTAVSYYLDTERGKPFAFGPSLFEAWVRQLPYALQRAGFLQEATPTTAIDPGAWVTPEMWGAVVEKDASDSVFVARRWTRPVSAPWSEVAANPWNALPRLPSPAGVAVPLWAAKTVSARLGARPQGWAAGERPSILLEGPASTAAAALGVVPPVQANRPSEPAQWGYFSANKVVDVEKGNVIEVTEVGAYRAGGARVVDEPLTAPGRFLEFWIKTTSTEPYTLKGSNGFVLHINSQHPMPRELTRPALGKLVIVTPDGSWRKLVVEAPGPVGELYLVPGPYAAYYERQRLDPSRVLLTGFAMRETDPGDATPPGQGPPQNPAEVRAQNAALVPSQPTPAGRASLVEFLKDQQEIVRLNAAAALRHLEVPEAVLGLIEQARSANPMIAEMALEALVRQGTNEAWAAILTIAVKGPFDHNRQFAVKHLGDKNDPVSAPSISTLMTCRSARAREEAARALGKIDDKDAGIILMALLMESDPNVRLAVVQGANTTLELVNRRLLWSAVNDPSELVRATSYRRLLDSPIADYRSEALKGVRDESVAIRLSLLEAMIASPKPEYRSALRLAVADGRAAVRAAALRGFAAIPGAVEPAEIENVFADRDPRVQLALIGLARTKGLRLPEETLANMRNSVSEEVVKQAKEMGL